MADSSVNPVEDFFQLMKTLLQAVKTVFPECEKTQAALAQLEFMESSQMTAAKEMLIRKYYDTIKPHIKDCVAKNDNVILRAEIEMLTTLGIREKWRDPDFDAESKDILWGYINSLNYLCCLHNESTPEEVQGIAAAASRLAESAQFDISDDGNVSFNIKAFQSLLSSDTAQGDLSQIMAGMGPLMGALGGGAGAEGGEGLQAFLSSQMSNFSTLLQPPPAGATGKK
jgi:hypothetical protein